MDRRRNRGAPSATTRCRWLVSPAAVGLLLGCRVEPMSLPPTQGDLVVQSMPADNAGAGTFDRFVTVFGVYLLASDGVPDDKLMHAAEVMAQYLDNDADGAVDVPVVVEAMVSRRSAMVMFEDERAAERSDAMRGLLDDLAAQDLYADETAPAGAFDASLEEVLHLITHVGYAHAFPQWYGERNSELSAAMDLARGGHFESVPSSYPPEAWYHYDDETCDYECMTTEYVYWALTSRLGAQAGRCESIAVEWEPCTPALVASMDPTVDVLLSDGRTRWPTVIPDGTYVPR